MKLFLSTRCMLLALTALFLLSLESSAQITDSSNRATVAANGYVISVRELTIPSGARYSLQDGNRRLARSDFNGAAAEFQRAISTFPSYYEAYFLLGITDMKIDRERDAEKAFRSAIEVSGGRYALAHFGLGLIFCSQKNFADAAAEVQTGLELDNKSWFGYYAEGRALFGLGRLEEAEKSARDLVSRKPDLAEAYLLLADIHQRQNRNSELLEDLNEYIALDEDSATRNRAREIRENVQRALPQMTRIVNPEP